MSIKPFASDKELINYAKWFLRDRVRAFRADVAICMTQDSKRHHAYFPALITCIAFLDLLSGLYAGKIEGHGLSQLKNYVGHFINATDYKHIDLLYVMFRHKIAHLAYPYIVFDTSTRSDIFQSQKHRRVTWTVYASRRAQAIELFDYPTDQTFLRTKTPWDVPYNSRIRVSVRNFQIDIVKSIYGSAGYLSNLKSCAVTREHFANCMKTYFPV